MNGPSARIQSRQDAKEDNRCASASSRLCVDLIRVAWIAAAFCLLVGSYMLYQHARASERDPWKSPQLLALKEKLRASPTDDAIKSEIRRLDLEFRQRYTRRLALDRTGGWLLVGGGAVLLLASRPLAKLRTPPWLPKLRTEPTDAARTAAAQARWAVAGLGAVALVGLLTLAFTASSPLPDSAAELERLLGRAPDSEDAASVPTLADFQANWPRFRGPAGSGTTKDAVTFDASTASVIWRSPINAAGFNSAVAWSNCVLVSGGDAAKREVVCFAAADGSVRWRRTIANVPGSPATAPEIPEMTGYAASTMACDGRRAFVLFANGDLAALNLDGTPAWSRNMGVPHNMYGHASSLALWPGRLIVQLDQDEGAPGGSKLLAFDPANGRLLWERSKPTHGSWATPIIFEAAGNTQIITLALPFIMSHALADGTELWRAELMEGEVTPSPIFVGGRLIVVNPSAELMAIRPDGAGDVSKSHLAWRVGDSLPDVTSPTGNDELVFTSTSMGLLLCYDARDGRKIWEHDLQMEVQSSPALAGDQLLILSTAGDLVAVEARTEFKERTRAKLGDAFYASPAFVGGRMFLRGTTNLWCLGK